ncbi:MAG: ABC transporter permease [Magnetospirillum sp.]
MFSVLKIAARNLMRYRRRTLLTALLITVGVMAVLLFVAVSGSFKAMMVGQITDSMLGHVQVHRKGYVASIDSLPLNLNLKPAAMARIEKALKDIPGVEASSPRVKFGAMFSNFTETTNIRLNAVYPDREAATVPLLPKRVSEGTVEDGLVAKGKILIPVLLAKGMKVGIGDTVVLVATNRDGSVNGRTFVVQGVLDAISGPGGRDGYMHIDDARTLLRMTEAEISEIAVRVADVGAVNRVTAALDTALGGETNQQGKPIFEVHSWEKLSPFASIARMIDLLTLFVQVILVAIVLVSVMNVMMMAVFERIREIGTIAAIGTPPGTILALFLTEGVLLGIVGAVIGTLASLAAIAGINAAQLTFQFGQQDDLPLYAATNPGSIAMISTIVIGVAVFGSLQPAWRASRMDPNTALRHV